MEKLSESERLVLKLQKDLEFVLKDKVSPFADSESLETRASGYWLGGDVKEYVGDLV